MSTELIHSRLDLFMDTEQVESRVAHAQKINADKHSILIITKFVLPSVFTLTFSLYSHGFKNNESTFYLILRSRLTGWLLLSVIFRYSFTLITVREMSFE
ncbi:hypothetical protein KC337_g36 [Hortaea werneckii]|nr:hypothetical protein KC337_g36 [Hortaea werneckii]